MKLLIAIPTTDQMPFQFVESLTKLIRRLDADNVAYDLVFQGGTLVYVGRDKLSLKAISGDYSHVLWLDSDMVFTEDLYVEIECERVISNRGKLWERRAEIIGFTHIIKKLKTVPSVWANISGLSLNI